MRVFVILLVAALVVPALAIAQPVPVARPALGFAATAGGAYAAMKSSGGESVKLLANWSTLEPAKGQFGFKPLDTAVAAAVAAGLRVVIVLAYTPKWASLATGAERNNPDIYSRQPPKRIADWEAFVTTTARRYQSKVKDWQVWTMLNLPWYRGTASEYLALVRAARAKTRAVDPTSRVIVSTPEGMDLALIRNALTAAGAAFDAITLNPQGMSPEELMRPLGALNERLLSRSPKQVWLDWDPRFLGERHSSPEQLVKLLAVARAFGVDVVFWAAPPSAELGAARRAFAERIGRQPFVGYLDQPGAIALAFGETPTSLIAWSTGSEAQLEVAASAAVYGASGESRQGSAAGERQTVTLAPVPVLIADAGAVVADAAKTTLQSRGLPVPPAARNYSQSPEVSARLGRFNAEEGLYNMRFRTRKNGAVEAVDIDGTEAVRTNGAKDIVFIYFDVDDSFLFYIDNRVSVEVTVEVHGASAAQQLGFNLLYDSLTGYRFTPWQWVEAKAGWVSYTFKLTDASFANTWGWDFAINAGGNRKEDLTVRSVTVRKSPRS